MAINPLIPLQVNVPDASGTFSNILLNLQRGEEMRQQRAEAPARNRLLQAQADSAEAAVPTKQQRFNQSQIDNIKSLATVSRKIIPDLQSGNISRVKSTLEARLVALNEAGIPNTRETEEALQLIDSNPQQLLRSSQMAVEVDKRLNQGDTGSRFQFGSQETFKDAEGNLFSGTQRRNPQDGQIESVLVPVGGGAEQPVGNVSLVSGLGQTAAERQATDISTAGGKEKAKLSAEAAARPGIEAGISEEKLKKQLQFKPQIEKAVIAARKVAQERGEVLNDLSRSRAAMPGLTKVVNQLKELATVATSTFGGRVFDAAVKETGFGSTKGATARAKFIAIVNNQVLPLLKPTFGGAFSVQEGESLKATMGDPNATPTEKIAQLEAFIAQKIRDVETKELQALNPADTPQVQEGATATNPQTNQKIIFKNGQWQPAT